MALLKQSTARVRSFLMIDSTDHLTGKTGLTVAVTLSKNGAAFGAAAGAVAEVSSGWYTVSYTTADTGTLGDLAVHATSAGADPSDWADEVLVDIPGGIVSSVTGAVGSVTARVTANTDQLNGTALTGRDIGASVLLSAGTGTGQLDFTSGVVKANLAQILGTALTETAGQIAAGFKQFFNIASPTSTMNVITTVTTATTATNLTNLPSIPANWLTAAGIAASALNGKGDWNIGKTGYALSAAGVQAIWDALTSALTTVGSIGKLFVDNLNATISSRMATYTQPTGFLAATFPTGTVANTTNITAGTVTTATNVTNVSAGGITAASHAAGAIDAASLATDAANEIRDAVLNGVVEGTTTVVQSLRLHNSVLGAKASGLDTTTAVFRDLADSKARVTATVDVNGNRTAISTDLT